MTVCRCGHDRSEHLWTAGSSAFAYKGAPECYCGCPLFRPVETPESLTLRGVETTE